MQGPSGQFAQHQFYTSVNAAKYKNVDEMETFIKDEIVISGKILNVATAGTSGETLIGHKRNLDNLSDYFINMKANSYFVLKKLVIPLYDFQITQDLDYPEIGLQHLYIQKRDNFIGFTADANDRISDLEEYSKYIAKKTVRNVGKNGLILKPTDKKTDFFKGHKAIMETFEGKEQIIKMITLKIDNYYYNILCSLTYETKKIIDEIEVKN